MQTTNGARTGSAQSWNGVSWNGESWNDETRISVTDLAKAQAYRYASLDTIEGLTAAATVLRFARSLRAPTRK
jgi:hypothetical protein